MKTKRRSRKSITSRCDSVARTATRGFSGAVLQGVSGRPLYRPRSNLGLLRTVIRSTTGASTLQLTTQRSDNVWLGSAKGMAKEVQCEINVETVGGRERGTIGRLGGGSEERGGDRFDGIEPVDVSVVVSSEGDVCFCATTEEEAFSDTSAGAASSEVLSRWAEDVEEREG